MPKTQSPVSLFIPCLVDQVYPEIGVAMLNVLRRFGFKVKYDSQQTCCGQPAFNSGNHAESRVVAKNFLRVFGDDDLIVSPSGSCTAMVRRYYGKLFEGAPEAKETKKVADSVFELSEFLIEYADFAGFENTFSGKIGFHNSCHSLRELRIAEAPLEILHRFTNDVVMPAGNPICCGFGGLFSIKFSSIAEAMAESRLDYFAKEGVETLVSNDPGCIMHMRQEATEKNMNMKIVHFAEFLDQNLSSN